MISYSPPSSNEPPLPYSTSPSQPCASQTTDPPTSANRTPTRASAVKMVSILNEDDKATVKRVIPKATNKIQAVGVARLYVAYPNRSKWMYTGIQGAIVLANDLVGNTYWLKMVDVSVRSPLPGGTPYPGQPEIGSPQLTRDIARQSRRNMGPGDLRYVDLQSGPNLLPHLRVRRLCRRPVLCR